MRAQELLTFIIQDKDVLRDDYQPETLEERDEELGEYAAALRPVIQGWQPNNVFLYGVTGVGKTAATHDLFEELQESVGEYDDVSEKLGRAAPLGGAQ